MVMLLLRPFCLFLIISTKLPTSCLVHHLLSSSTAAEEEHVRSAAVSQPFVHAGGANNAVAQKKVLRLHSVLHSSISELFFGGVFVCFFPQNGRRMCWCLRPRVSKPGDAAALSENSLFSSLPFNAVIIFLTF